MAAVADVRSQERVVVFLPAERLLHACSLVVMSSECRVLAVGVSEWRASLEIKMGPNVSDYYEIAEYRPHV